MALANSELINRASAASMIVVVEDGGVGADEVLA